MTAIIPASAWRHQRATAVEPMRDPDRKGRIRVLLAMLGFGILYGALAARLVLLGVTPRDLDDDGVNFARPASLARPDIVDRNGETLATDIRTAALFAEPRYVIDPDEATEMIASVLPDLDRGRLRQILSSNAKFAYIKREITPRQQQAIHQLGIPGIGFRVETRRFSPGGADGEVHR
jgi:cell division protein FtsI (penicillin-binding protein 3)